MFKTLKRGLDLHYQWTLLNSSIKKLGLLTTLRLRFQLSDLNVRVKGVSEPLLIRVKSSDRKVFRQIFIKDDYACLGDIADAGLIIDAGANVGYSSIYFLSKFPNCRVVAIEPDPNNFAALKRNLAPYADRVELHHTGVWSHTTHLVLEEDRYRDGRDWSRQVRERQDGEEGGMKAICLDDILKASSHDRASLLKMDIEGAEAVVFAPGAYQSWLGSIDAIAIELHDDSHFGVGSEVFCSAIQGQDFEVSNRGELTICRRPTTALS